jgi:cytochrome c oxidase assembly factor CtaG
MRSWLARLRPWLALAGAALIVVALVPPVGSLARRYEFVQALQFVIFACAGPALVVLGAPWRRLALAARPGSGAARLADRLARARSRRPGALRALGWLAAFIALAVGWRLPATVGALSRDPGLAVVEMVTLVGAGTGVWLELVESPPLLPRLPPQLRTAVAALAMWTNWTLGYLMGMSGGAWAAAFVHSRGLALSTAADQQIATAILWAVPALCFVPVIFVTLMTWLRDTEDPDEELRRASAKGTGRTGLPGAPRPPRGWQTPSA